MVAGYLRAGKERRKGGAEICADNPVHGQSMVRAARGQRPVNRAKSDVGRLEDASLKYLGYVRLCWPGPLSMEMNCQIPGKKDGKRGVWRKKTPHM